MRSPVGERAVADQHCPDPQREGRGDLREHLDEREVHRDETLRAEPRFEVAARHGLELGLVRLLPHERLRDADAGQALLQVRVHRGDVLARALVRLARLPLEPERGEEQRREHQRGRERQLPAHEREHDGDADNGHRVHECGDQSGLEELRERVDVGGHAGHDPPGHLALVEVDAEPLQVGEDLDPQREQQAFRGATHDARLRPHHPPVREGHGEERGARREERRERVGGDALVDAESHEPRTGQRREAVEGHEDEADDEPEPVGAEERAEPEAVLRPGLRRDVDVGLVDGFGERRDLGQELRGGGEHRAHAADRAHAPTASAGWTHSTGCCGRRGREERLGLGLERPGRRRDPELLGRGERLSVADDRVVHGRVVVPSGCGRARRCPRRRRRVPRGASGTARHRSMSSSWVPASTMWPSSTTAIRSASSRVERRCAMRIVVRPTRSRRSVAWISSSTRASTAEVASSSSRMLRVAQQRPGECDPLTLTARQREPLLADHRVVAVGQRHHELVGLGRTCGCFHICGARVGTRERDVGADRVREEE